MGSGQSVGAEHPGGHPQARGGSRTGGQDADGLNIPARQAQVLGGPAQRQLQPGTLATENDGQGRAALATPLEQHTGQVARMEGVVGQTPLSLRG